MSELERLIGQVREEHRNMKRDLAGGEHLMDLLEAYRIAAAGWVLLASCENGAVEPDAVSWAEDVWAGRNPPRTAHEALFYAVEKEVKGISGI